MTSKGSIKINYWMQYHKNITKYYSTEIKNKVNDVARRCVNENLWSYNYLSSLSMAFLSVGLFFFGGTGGHTFPQMSWMLRLIWQLRVAALVRIRSMAVMPSPWARRFDSMSSSQDAEREFCLDDIFWWSLMRRDNMLSRISRISVTSCGGVPGGTQRVEELLGLTACVASVVLRLIISWNFLLRSATRLNTWASRRF